MQLYTGFEWVDTTEENIVENEFYDIDLFDIESDVDYLLEEYVTGTDEEIERLREKLIKRSYEYRDNRIKDEFSLFKDRKSILDWLDAVIEYSDEMYFLTSSEILEEIIKNYNKI